MSFATPRMTSITAKPTGGVTSSLTSLSLKSNAVSQNTNNDVLDFAGAVSVEAPAPAQVPSSIATATPEQTLDNTHPTVEIQATITPVQPNDDLSLSLFQQAKQQANALRCKIFPNQTTADAGHKLTKDEIVSLKNEFKNLCVNDQAPDFQDWVQNNSQRMKVSSMPAGNQMLLQQYVQLREACIVAPKTRIAPRALKVAASAQVQTNNVRELEERLNALQTKVHEHEQGLLHHTDVMQKVDAKLYNHAQYTTRTAADIKNLKTKLQHIDHGLVHHTSVLQNCSDALKQHKSILTSQQQNVAKVQQVSGGRASDEQFSCYEDMQRMLQS